MTVQHIVKEDVLVVCIQDNLAGVETFSIKENIYKILKISKKVIFDLSGVPFADELGMGLLLSLYKKQGNKLLLFGLSKEVRNKIEILGLGNLEGFQIFETEQEAIESF